MSAGIGRLQREILDTLAARPGGDMIEDYRGYRAWLEFGAHDLRAVSCEMAKKMDGLSYCHYSSESWQPAFSRAIAGLSNRNMLEVLWLVPLRGVEPEFEIQNVEIAGDFYLKWFSRQRRFVGKRPDFITLNKAASSKYGTDLLY